MRLVFIIAFSWAVAGFPLRLIEKIGKYPNDNSFVQLYKTGATKVVGKNVEILLPQSLNYDSLMELLIKIRSVKTFGAKSIALNSEVLLKDIQLIGELSEELSLEDLLDSAGAEFIIEKGMRRAISHSVLKKNQQLVAHSLIGSSNHPKLLNEISSLLKKAPLDFNDLVGVKDKLSGRKIYWISASMAPVNDHFFKTLAEIRWLHKQGAVVHLISPYLPYARSDKPEFDIGITTAGRLIADLIESVETAGITVVRAHAPQSLGFFKIYAQEISGRKTIIDYLKNEQVEHIISPDAGFQKDATKYQLELSKANDDRPIGLSVMNKERDKNGKEKIHGGTNLEQIRGKNVAIIDDETATGGTLDEVGKFIAAYGPKNIFAVVTHLAGPAQRSLNSNFIERLVVTNTVPVMVENPRLKVLSMAKEIAESIAMEDQNTGEPTVLMGSH